MEPGNKEMAPPIDAALLDGFRRSSTAVISDNLHRLPGAVGLRPYHRGGTMVGVALTVRTRAGDNLRVHEALEILKAGEVLVVDGGGDTSRALIGEIMTTIAAMKGAAGIVVDGAIRDLAAIGKSDFPCFARGVTHRGPYKDGPGDINVPVTIGGMVVSPGDIVVADDDGVVAFPPSDARALLDAVVAQEAREVEIIRSIHAGTYRGAYGKQTKSPAS